MISWAGPTVTVLAEVPGERPVFVGLANSVDVQDYLSGTAHVLVDDYRVPWHIRTSRGGGKPNLPASPTALDWWIADAAGLGGGVLGWLLVRDRPFLRRGWGDDEWGEGEWDDESEGKHQ